MDEGPGTPQDPIIQVVGRPQCSPIVPCGRHDIDILELALADDPSVHHAVQGYPTGDDQIILLCSFMEDVTNFQNLVLQYPLKCSGDILVSLGKGLMGLSGGPENFLKFLRIAFGGQILKIEIT